LTILSDTLSKDFLKCLRRGAGEVVVKVEEGPFDIVLDRCFVFDGEESLDGPKTIGVRDGLIAAISNGPLSGREILDARGLWVGPGLIESHIHS